jgi:hypothetical protein
MKLEEGKWAINGGTVPGWIASAETDLRKVIEEVKSN